MTLSVFTVEREDLIRVSLEQRKLPIAMALTEEEKKHARYKGVRSACPSTSECGWKLAHLTPVALGGRGALANYPPPVIEAHFTRFLSPSNMLVPN